MRGLKRRRRRNLEYQLGELEKEEIRVVDGMYEGVYFPIISDLFGINLYVTCGNCRRGFRRRVDRLPKYLVCPYCGSINRFRRIRKVF